MVKFAAVLAALAFVASSDAHPGQPHGDRSLAELDKHRQFKAQAHRSLTACANHQGMRKLQERAAARRLDTVNALRAERRRLAAADVLAKDHKSSLTGITPSDIDPVQLFGSTPKCVLEPEVTQGPYYVSGELIRNDIRETQAGVDLYTQLQFIDINTCEPVPDYYVDFWHCNATGVYAGVVASGNGDSSDITNINATFARGLYPTDEDGLVQFITKYPGHYTGRTNHIHILGSHGGTVLPNNTYVTVGTSSVGQIFFDQSLTTEVEKTGVYATNTQPLTTNAADSIFAQEAATGFDPVVEYVYLGDNVEDGIFSWISIGVDTKISKSIGAAAIWTASGGVASGNSFNGGNGGNGGPGSGMGPPPNGSGSFGGMPPSGSGAGGLPGNVTTAPDTTTPSTTATACSS